MDKTNERMNESSLLASYRIKYQGAPGFLRARVRWRAQLARGLRDSVAFEIAFPDPKVENR